MLRVLSISALAVASGAPAALNPHDEALDHRIAAMAQKIEHHHQKEVRATSLEKTEAPSHWTPENIVHLAALEKMVAMHEKMQASKSVTAAEWTPESIAHLEALEKKVGDYQKALARRAMVKSAGASTSWTPENIAHLSALEAAMGKIEKMGAKSVSASHWTPESIAHLAALEKKVAEHEKVHRLGARAVSSKWTPELLARLKAAAVDHVKASVTDEKHVAALEKIVGALEKAKAAKAAAVPKDGIEAMGKKIGELMKRATPDMQKELKAAIEKMITPEEKARFAKKDFASPEAENEAKLTLMEKMVGAFARINAAKVPAAADDNDAIKAMGKKIGQLLKGATPEMQTQLKAAMEKLVTPEEAARFAKHDFATPEAENEAKLAVMEKTVAAFAHVKAAKAVAAPTDSDDAIKAMGKKIGALMKRATPEMQTQLKAAFEKLVTPEEKARLSKKGVSPEADKEAKLALMEKMIGAFEKIHSASVPAAAAPTTEDSPVKAMEKKIGALLKRVPKEMQEELKAAMLKEVSAEDQARLAKHDFATPEAENEAKLAAMEKLVGVFEKMTAAKRVAATATRDTPTLAKKFRSRRLATMLAAKRAAAKEAKADAANAKIAATKK